MQSQELIEPYQSERMPGAKSLKFKKEKRTEKMPPIRHPFVRKKYL